MKKVMIALVFIAFTLGNAAFAGEKGIDKRVRQAFEKEFAGALDVQWYPYDEYIKVDFTFNNMRLRAWYNNDGETLALFRNIQFSQLPLMLQLDLKKSYKGYWITQIYELSNEKETQYHVVLENADMAMQLRSSGNNDWKFVRKEPKN